MANALALFEWVIAILFELSQLKLYRRQLIAEVGEVEFLDHSFSFRLLSSNQ